MNAFDKRLKKLGVNAGINAPQMSNDIANILNDIAYIRKLASGCELVIASSFGCFQTLMANVNIGDKIFINPCLFPSLEIPPISDISQSELNQLIELEQTLSHQFDKSQHYFISKDDELFGSENVLKHIRLLEKFLPPENIRVYNTTKHTLTRDVMNDICKFIDEEICDLDMLDFGDPFSLDASNEDLKDIIESEEKETMIIDKIIDETEEEDILV
jgi:hypothetical protein